MTKSKSDEYILNTDGGARGNPGPSAAAAVLKNTESLKVKEVGKYLGNATNNEAEYQALLIGLELAIEEKAKKLKCYLDSELIVKQLNGEYKIKVDRLKVFYKKVKELESKFDLISYTHVPRESNKEADALVNKVLDSVL